MTEIESNEAVEFAQEETIDPIEAIYTGQCESLSGRSTLTYAYGYRAADDSHHVRIVRNSGGGMACTAWAAATDIDVVVHGETELTSKAFLVLHPGKSINTGGFLLSLLKDAGLIGVNPENSRFHSHVAGTTCTGVVLARLAEAKEAGCVRTGKSKIGRKASEATV
jgi:hypothetical protein